MARDAWGPAVTVVGVLLLTLGVLVSVMTEFDLVAGVVLGIGFCLAIAGSRGFLARLLHLEPDASEDLDEPKSH